MRNWFKKYLSSVGFMFALLAFQNCSPGFHTGEDHGAPGNTSDPFGTDATSLDSQLKLGASSSALFASQAGAAEPTVALPKSQTQLFERNLKVSGTCSTSKVFLRVKKGQQNLMSKETTCSSGIYSFALNYAGSEGALTIAVSSTSAFSTSTEVGVIAGPFVSSHPAILSPPIGGYSVGVFDPATGKNVYRVVVAGACSLPSGNISITSEASASLGPFVTPCLSAGDGSSTVGFFMREIEMNRALFVNSTKINVQVSGQSQTRSSVDLRFLAPLKIRQIYRSGNTVQVQGSCPFSGKVKLRLGNPNATKTFSPNCEYESFSLATSYPNTSNLLGVDVFQGSIFDHILKVEN